MKKTTQLIALCIISLGLMNLSAEEAPAAPEKPVQKAEKESLTGTFTKNDAGKVFLTTQEGKKYIVVKKKIEQIGENYDKKVVATCKTKVAKDGKTKLIVQINKIEAAPEEEAGKE